MEPVRGWLDSPTRKVNNPRLDGMPPPFSMGGSNFPGGIRMRLFEMKHRPDHAGKAKIEFSNVNNPVRQGVDIALPNARDNEFFPLRAGRQFLFRHWGDHEDHYWFGGTDEQPFLTRITKAPYQAFFKGGEPTFYQHLMPDLVVELRQDFGFRYRRQGDIFAVSLPYRWSELIKYAALMADNGIKQRALDNFRVFDTRHVLTGSSVEDVPIGGETYWLCLGTLEAPDHRPLSLKQPTILVQAHGLHEPKKAD